MTYDQKLRAVAAEYEYLSRSIGKSYALTPTAPRPQFHLCPTKILQEQQKLREEMPT